MSDASDLVRAMAEGAAQGAIEGIDTVLSRRGEGARGIPWSSTLAARTTLLNAIVEFRKDWDYDAFRKQFRSPSLNVLNHIKEGEEALMRCALAFDAGHDHNSRPRSRKPIELVNLDPNREPVAGHLSQAVKVAPPDQATQRLPGLARQPAPPRPDLSPRTLLG